MSEFPSFDTGELGHDAQKDLMRLGAVDDPEVMGAAEHMFVSRKGSKAERQEADEYFVKVLIDRGYISRDDPNVFDAMGGIEAACRRRLDEENRGR